MESWRIITLVAISIALTMVVTSGEDKAKEKEVCKQERMDMAKCLPFMKGQAKSPTSDCCSNLKEILNSDKNCICVIIQDRNDPVLGLQINVTLSFSLPSICHVTANVAKCPALLHLDPNSPEAQVFYQIQKALDQTGPAPISAPEPSSMPPTAGSDDSHQNTSLPGTNHAQTFHKRWLGLEVVVHFFLILYLIILNGK